MVKKTSLRTPHYTDTNASYAQTKEDLQGPQHAAHDVGGGAQAHKAEHGSLQEENQAVVYAHVPGKKFVRQDVLYHHDGLENRVVARHWDGIGQMSSSFINQQRWRHSSEKNEIAIQELLCPRGRPVVN